MKKLLIHIGVPKSATTSLQASFFPNIDSSYLFYAGVYQPRTLNQSDIYKKFALALYYPEKIDDFIASCNSTGVDEIVISEEMVLVDAAGVSWQRKLENLFLMLRSFDYKIILTVRDPVNAAHSFYCESSFDLLFLSRLSFLESLVTINNFKIFNYPKLIKSLGEIFGPENIAVVHFEDLIDGKFGGLKQVFPKVVYEKLNRLPDSNDRKKDPNFIYTNRFVTISERWHFFSIVLDRLKSIAPSRMSVVTKLIGAVKNFPLFELKVPILREDEKILAADILKKL